MRLFNAGKTKTPLTAEMRFLAPVNDHPPARTKVRRPCGIAVAFRDPAVDRIYVVTTNIFDWLGPQAFTANRVPRPESATMPVTPRDRAMIGLTRSLTNRPRPETELEGWKVAQDG